jgi:hypothetical protein
VNRRAIVRELEQAMELKRNHGVSEQMGQTVLKRKSMKVIKNRGIQRRTFYKGSLQVEE